MFTNTRTRPFRFSFSCSRMCATKTQAVSLLTTNILLVFFIVIKRVNLLIGLVVLHMTLEPLNAKQTPRNHSVSFARFIAITKPKLRADVMEAICQSLLPFASSRARSSNESDQMRHRNIQTDHKRRQQLGVVLSQLVSSLAALSRVRNRKRNDTLCCAKQHEMSAETEMTSQPIGIAGTAN